MMVVDAMVFLFKRLENKQWKVYALYFKLEALKYSTLQLHEKVFSISEVK